MKARQFLVVVILVVLLLAGAGLYGDVTTLLATARDFGWWVVLPALTLAFLNYLIRFGKWHYFLHAGELPIPIRVSFPVFLAGLSMSVTPGKVGEVLKCYLLKQICDSPASRTFPVVLAERLTDLLAVVALAAYGVTSLGVGLDVLAAAVSMCGVIVVFAVWRRGFRWVLGLASWIPFVRKRSEDLLSMQESLAGMVGWKPMLTGIAISVVAWFAECVAFYLILGAAGSAVSLANAVFAYSLGTVAGAVTMLPGGLVATEASMVGLLERVLGCCSASQAITAVLVVRLCTLWFSVVLGAVALRWVRRMNVRM